MYTNYIIKYSLESKGNKQSKRQKIRIWRDLWNTKTWSKRKKKKGRERKKKQMNKNEETEMKEQSGYKIISFFNGFFRVSYHSVCNLFSSKNYCYYYCCWCYYHMIIIVVVVVTLLIIFAEINIDDLDAIT